jgi:antitoxin (DNA-binding transcriptional repressor) of toxin-antitoxin stability system
MTTLTITDAKKNLTKWLQAAARGEDVGIISGADVIALRKVQVESTDYAWREYGVTQKELEAYEKRVDARFKRLKKSGRLKTMKPADVRREIEKASHH